MGVDSIPRCYQGIFCGMCNWVIKSLVYTPFIQNWVAPAGYFRDVQNFDKYVKSSVFLPTLNDEWAMTSEFSALRKNRFTALNNVMLVKFEDDHVIYPKETAWFQSLDRDGKTVLPLNATHFYSEDYIGVRELNEAGKI